MFVFATKYGAESSDADSSLSPFRSQLVTAKHIFGLGLFTGKQTKLMKNMIKPRLKRTKMDKACGVLWFYVPLLLTRSTETQPHYHACVCDFVCRVLARRCWTGRLRYASSALNADEREREREDRLTAVHHHSGRVSRVFAVDTVGGAVVHSQLHDLPHSVRQFGADFALRVSGNGACSAAVIWGARACVFFFATTSCDMCVRL